MIQVLKVMEKAGSKETGVVIDYIRDAFLEIESMYFENVDESYINIVSGQTLYDLPADFVMNGGIQISKSVADYENYKWTVQGRKLRLLKYDSALDGYVAPNVSYANGILVKHTVLGKMFVYNPDGDDSYYSVTSAETSGVAADDIVYVVDGHSAGGERYHYYKALTDIPSTDLSVVDFSDTTTWEDVTEIASPDEFSYINADGNLALSIIEFVKSKLVEKMDMRLSEVYLRNFRAKADQSVVIRKGRRTLVISPTKRATSFLRRS